MPNSGADLHPGDSTGCIIAKGDVLSGGHGSVTYMRPNVEIGNHEEGVWQGGEDYDSCVGSGGEDTPVGPTGGGDNPIPGKTVRTLFKGMPVGAKSSVLVERR